MGTTASLKARSCLNLPSSTSFSISLFVAEITLISTLILWLLPSLVNSFSSRTLSSFACAERLRSVTSSKNSVPPSAISSFPGFLDTAPVKAPFS